MAIQLLKFRELADGTFKAVVWIDDTKTGDDGSPDPDFLREFEYGPVPQGITKAAFLTQIRREMKLLVLDEISVVASDPGTPLTGEGTIL